jgi:hypothetical protein
MKKFLDNIKLLWESLPKEIKVALYIALSYALSQVILMLSELQVDNRLLAFGINILLVFLGQLKPRIEARKEERVEEKKAEK